MIDWNKIRQDFPVTETCVYFMSAAMSPPPRPVYLAIQARYEGLLREGDVHWAEEMEGYKSLCRRLADLVGAGPDDIAFAPNTSTAMGIMALSFKNQTGGPFNIVSMKDEFPASTVAFEHLGIPMRYVEPEAARYPVQAVLDLVDDRTLAVVTSHVQYCTGFRQDLLTLGQKLCDRGILFIVNATQSLPIYPVDVRTMHIDALTASLHKWGMTGHVGSLFYTSPAFRRRFPSPLAGWLSIASGEGEGIHVAKNEPFRLLDSAHRYEFGTFNLIPLLGFGTALDYMEAIGIENIRRRIKELADYLIDGLRSLNIAVVSPIDKDAERSAIVSMTLGNKNTAGMKKLEEARIFVSLRTGYIRVAVNFFNDRNDIDRLLGVLKTV
jgi:cysteine desulfurase / selenocysteine lyase